MGLAFYLNQSLKQNLKWDQRKAKIKNSQILYKNVPNRSKWQVYPFGVLTK